MLQINIILVTLFISSVKFSKLKKKKKQVLKTHKTTISITTMITTGHEKGI